VSPKPLVAACVPAAIVLILLAPFFGQALARNRGFLDLARLVAQTEPPTAEQVDRNIRAFQGAGFQAARGQALVEMVSGDCRSALGQWEAYTQSHPAEVLPAYWVGHCAAQLGDWQTAVRVWQQARLVRPLQEAGNALAARQQWQSAALAYQAVAVLTPNDCIYGARGVYAAWWLDRATAAATTRLDALAASCPNALEVYLVRGRLLIEVQEFARAETWLSQARQLAPDSERPLTTLALLRLRENRPSDALPLLETALRLNPQSSNALTLMGLAYSALGQTAPAVAAYENALGLGTDEAWVYEALGAQYEKLGQRERAVAAYQQSLRREPDRKYARARLTALQGGEP
jgi:tetratricopeptide (TPR) repeat protein